jgi:hypothetical protein
MLKKYYDSTKGIMRDERNITYGFNISCGVKQVDILSSYLSNLFIYDFLTECLEKNVGVIFKNINVSIIAYADDIILISTSQTDFKEKARIFTFSAREMSN